MTLNCYQYQIPFVTPLKTSTRTYSTREGLILVSHSSDNPIYGEAAPLPGFSKSSLSEVIQILIDNRGLIESILSADAPLDQLNNLYKQKDIPAALQFGIDAIASQLEARLANKSIASYLFPKLNNETRVNTLVSLNKEDPLTRVKQKKSLGFKTIKCKIGVNIQQEFEVLQEIRSQFPELIIRLDANQAWSLEQAITHCQLFEALQIEYIEEPLSINTPENFEKLSKKITLPIAIDESVAQHSYWPNLLPYTNYLIIKPMIIGGFRKNIETKKLADTHNNKVVVTTSLESNVGRYFTGIMAAGIGDRKTAHGLATGELLSEDILPDDSLISNGYLTIMQSHLGTIDFRHQQLFTNVF